jgi:hypothetical protein
MVKNMEELVSNIKTLKLLIVIWFLSFALSSVMFTMAIIYDIKVCLIISCLTGILSLLGIFVCAYMIIRIENNLKYLTYKTNN